MIVAPLMLSIRCLAFSALAGDKVLFRRSVVAITAGSVMSIGLGLSVEHRGVSSVCDQSARDHARLHGGLFSSGLHFSAARG